MSQRNTKQIVKLNDRLRQSLGMPVIGKQEGRFVVTRGVATLSEKDQIALFTKIREFKEFNKDNDTYKEHDFGAVSLNGQTFFWKIDYYAPDMEHGSEDPADPEKTVRVLTVMLAEEY